MPSSLIDKIVSEAKEYNKARVERENAGEPTFLNTAKKIGHNILEAHSQFADDVIDKVRDFRGERGPKRKPILELTAEEQAFAELYYHIGNTYEFRQIITGTQSVAELAREVEVRPSFFSFSGGLDALRGYRETHVKPMMSDRMEDIMNQVDEAKALRANIEQEKLRLSHLEAAFLPNKKPQTSYSNMMEASITYVQEQLDNAMEAGDGDNIVKYHDSLRLMKSALDAYNGVAPEEPANMEQPDENHQGNRFNGGYGRKGYGERRNNRYQNNRRQNENQQRDGYQNNYQNNGYQNNRYQNNRYQNNGYQNNGYQNNGYQNDGYRKNKFNKQNNQYAKNFEHPIEHDSMIIASGPTYPDAPFEPQPTTRRDVHVEDKRVFSFDEVDESTLQDTPRPTRPRDHKRRLRPIMTQEQFQQPVPEVSDSDVPPTNYTTNTTPYEPDFLGLSDLDAPPIQDDGYGY